MPNSFSIPELYMQEIRALIRAGYYSNKSEVVREALRDFFERKKELRVIAAVELYKNGEVTLSRGAEIAGVSFGAFKDLLKERGIKIIVHGQSKEEIDKGIELIRKLRK